ncbi:FH1/FH2 domain-containing protein 3 [Pristis pectinata]|uniref:FH1/FH2 domain-containing protein 3 n=1 Tax=Pristis pectinata TaxID=685728 RepID=UPI00223DC97A|nr:FH1/FH2 domain-containing protein 3 [Pristis pectinata]
MISDFALEYHVARHQILQQRERREREKERRQGVRGFGETDSPPSVVAVSWRTFPDSSQQHEDMKEILSTPERSRKFDSSLPRSRRKKEILDQKKFPW